MFNLWGILSIAVFYVAVLLIGIFASRRANKQAAASTTETEAMLVAGRNMNFCLSLLSATATAVCGAYLTGTAEIICTTNRIGGLVWCLTPIGAFAGVLFGLVMAKPLREGEYLTMIGPFEQHYGRFVGVLFATISIFAELMWTASVLNALGATIAVVLDADNTVAVIISSVIVVFYTILGGLYAVAYTDVVQVFTVFIGLWICVPFALTNPNVKDLSFTAQNITTVVNSTRGWYGELHVEDAGIYVEFIIMILLGGSPWSSWIQRMLACKTPRQAQKVAMISGISFAVFAVPAIILGAVAASTEWEYTDYNRTLTNENAGLALPLTLQYLTPTAVAFVGLGAISAAVMSSADSTILAISSLFSQNIYKSVIRKQPSDKEILWVIRGTMVVAGILATTLALMVRGVYVLYIACNEFAYIMMFPQLFLVLNYPKYMNKWGCLAGVLFGVTLRLLLGELFGLPAVIKLPLYDEVRQIQLLPIRTMCMLVTTLAIISVSLLVRYFEKRTHKKRKHSEGEQKYGKEELDAAENEKLTY